MEDITAKKYLLRHDPFADLLLKLGILVYALGFFLFYPPIFSIADESGYLSMAYALRHGTLFPDQAGTPNNLFLSHAGRWVSISPLGNALTLAPFGLLSWDHVFIRSFLAHLLGTFFFLKLLKRAGLSSVWALLFLLFPAFIIYSRTIMSDIPSLALFLMGIYFYMQDKPGKSGIFFGLSLLFRITNLAGVIPFGLGFLVCSFQKRSLRPLLLFSSGLVISAALTMLQNFLFYGSSFTLGVSSDMNGVVNFSFDYLRGNLSHYLSSILLFYPSMGLVFLWPAAYRRRPAMAWSAVFTLAFFALYYYHDQFSGQLSTLMLGIRYIFLLIPFLLLSYAEVLEGLLDKLPSSFRRIFFVSLFLILSAGSLAVQKRHFDFLQGQLGLKQLIYKNTNEGSVLIHDVLATELVQRQWGARDYVYCGIGDLEKKIAAQDFSKNVFLVTRDLPEKNIKSVLQDELNQLNKWQVTTVASGQGVTVSRIEKR